MNFKVFGAVAAMLSVFAASNIAKAQETENLRAAKHIFALPNVRMMQRLHTPDPNTTITVNNLPKGLVFNSSRCLIEGTLKHEGEYKYTVTTKCPNNEQTDTISLTVSRNLIQPTPFMGWLSWNVFEKEIDEEKFLGIVDAMEKNGLIEAGYKYACLDDLWHAPTRNKQTGKPEYNTAKFPKGLEYLVDYAHSKGLKIGIYSDAAPRTCAGAFGSYKYEDIDARQYAEWKFDLLKYDYCGAPADVETALKRYKVMGDALKASGRDILFYMCEWGAREPWKWGAKTGATCWRCTYDTRDCWVGKPGGIGVTQSIEFMKDLWPYSGPNRFNDADMMCIGLHGKGKSSNDLCLTGPGMTQNEYQTQFALWCMWSSPLTLAFDIRNVSQEDLAIITNKEMIAINQDKLGQQAEYIGEVKKGVQLYVKDLYNGDIAIAVVNLNKYTANNIKIDFSNLKALKTGKLYTIRDCINLKYAGNTQNQITIQNLGSHSTCVYRLSR